MTTSNPTIGPTSPEAPTRQGRKKRNPRLAKHRSMDTILSGWEALAALHRYRALLPRHIAQLLFWGKPDSNGKPRSFKAARQTANRDCLGYLKDRGFVDVIDAAIRLPDRKRLIVKEMLILTRSGHDHLKEHWRSQGLVLPSYSDPGTAMFEVNFKHWLSIVDMAVSAEASIVLQGGEVELFWDDYTIRRKSKSRTDPINWGGLEPDGLMIATIGGERRALLFEADQDTESIASNAPNSIRTKTLKYREFFIGLRRHDPLLMDLKQPTVHWACTNRNRMDHVRAEVERQGGKQSYWYSLHEWLQPDFHFLSEVWQVSGREGFHQAIKIFQA